ncbi:MAG: formimidoylglutamate deiminase [Micromonosporaceae bacterium]|nr:formimidoylglutamate deiminase [Micromonosporaceae bacterium]
MRRFYADRAWLGAEAGVVEQVLITVEGDRIAGLDTGAAAAPPDATRLPGLVIPGLVNAHSHAFHRALRGRTHAGRGDFWSWREQMYAVAERLDPDSYRELARATYAEMVLAGITTVVEFHYLHHAPGGAGYADPHAMSQALTAAADEAGIRLVLLDTCYLQSDVDGTPLRGPQLRFTDGDVDAWAARASVGPAKGAAIHSVRGCPPDAMRTVAEWAADRNAPLHLHLSEQRKENDACLAAHGRTPAQLCADTGVLGAATTAVHATHLTEDDVELVGGSRTNACFCPTTERDLADGVGPASALARAGAPLSLGSDSHAVIDLFEEARAVELNERLVTERRGSHTAASLLAAATAGGAHAAGLRGEAGRLAVGALADFAAVRLDSPRLAGAPLEDPVAAVVFAATASDVADVVRGGRLVVAGGAHRAVDDVPAALDTAIRALL